MTLTLQTRLSNPHCLSDIVDTQSIALVLMRTLTTTTRCCEVKRAIEFIKTLQVVQVCIYIKCSCGLLYFIVDYVFHRWRMHDPIRYSHLHSLVKLNKCYRVLIRLFEYALPCTQRWNKTVLAYDTCIHRGSQALLKVWQHSDTSSSTKLCLEYKPTK